MILTNIKQYLREHKRATLQNLALHFDMELDAMRGMLEHWIRKGKVRRQIVKNACKGCSECNSSEIEFYEWIA